MILLVVVNGFPAPQGSKIPGVSKSGKGFVREQNSVAQKSWRQDVRQACIEARQAAGLVTLEGVALDVEVMFRVVRPASVSITKRPFPNVKPDLDKLVRNTLDGMTQAGVWKDDAQVVGLKAFKMYATDDPWNTPGATIRVHLVSPPEII